jgi:hypothetical protein
MACRTISDSRLAARARRQESIFLAFFNAMPFPVVRQFIPGFLTKYPLLYPFFKTSVFTPQFTETIQDNFRVKHFLDAS